MQNTLFIYQTLRYLINTELLYTEAQNLDYTGAVGRFHHNSISATNKVHGDIIVLTFMAVSNGLTCPEAWQYSYWWWDI